MDAFAADCVPRKRIVITYIARIKCALAQIYTFCTRDTRVSFCVWQLNLFPRYNVSITKPSPRRTTPRFSSQTLKNHFATGRLSASFYFHSIRKEIWLWHLMFRCCPSGNTRYDSRLVVGRDGHTEQPNWSSLSFRSLTRLPLVERIIVAILNTAINECRRFIMR